MACGEDEAITVCPRWIDRVVPEEAGPEDIRHVRGPHGKPGVTRAGLLDRIRGQQAHGRHREAVEVVKRRLDGSQEGAALFRDGHPVSLNPPRERREADGR